MGATTGSYALADRPHGRVTAVASPTPGHAEELAGRYGIGATYTDYHDMLSDPQVDIVSITAPNVLHCQITLDAAAAGKHVIVEKPMAMSLEECDAMIAACERAGVHLFYAEELFFTPKYVKAKEMADQGVPSGRCSSSSSRRCTSARMRTGSGTWSSPAEAPSWTWDATGWPSPTGSSDGRHRCRSPRT